MIRYKFRLILKDADNHVWDGRNTHILKNAAQYEGEDAAKLFSGNIVVEVFKVELKARK